MVALAAESTRHTVPSCLIEKIEAWMAAGNYGQVILHVSPAGEAAAYEFRNMRDWEHGKVEDLERARRRAGQLPT